MPIVSRRLDHRRISTTLDFYVHVTPAGDRFAAEVLQSVLCSRPDGVGTLEKVQQLVYYSKD
jgi:hypothetical protein